MTVGTVDVRPPQLHDKWVTMSVRQSVPLFRSSKWIPRLPPPHFPPSLPRLSLSLFGGLGLGGLAFFLGGVGASAVLPCSEGPVVLRGSAVPVHTEPSDCVFHGSWTSVDESPDTNCSLSRTPPGWESKSAELSCVIRSVATLACPTRRSAGSSLRHREVSGCSTCSIRIGLES